MTTPSESRQVAPFTCHEATNEFQFAPPRAVLRRCWGVFGQEVWKRPRPQSQGPRDTSGPQKTGCLFPLSATATEVSGDKSLQEFLFTQLSNKHRGIGHRLCAIDSEGDDQMISQFFEWAR
jgi:hypothetical protein